MGFFDDFKDLADEFRELGQELEDTKKEIFSSAKELYADTSSAAKDAKQAVNEKVNKVIPIDKLNSKKIKVLGSPQDKIHKVSPKK